MMSRSNRQSFVAGIGAVFVCVAPWTSSLLAQTSATLQSGAANMLDAQHVPDDALAVAVLSPADFFDNPALELFPVEVFRVQAKEQFGIDPVDVSEVRAVVSLDPQNMQPKFGVIAKLNGQVDMPKLVEAMNVDPNTIRVGTLTAHPIQGPPGTVIALVDPQTIFLGMSEYLQTMLDAEGDSGALPTLLKTMPATSGLSVALVMEQIRPMVSGLAMQQAGNLAPDLQPLAQIPGLTDAVKLHIGLDGHTGGLDLSLIGTDDVAAERIEAILADSLVAARELGIAEVQRSMSSSDQSPAMQEASQSYANRIADLVVDHLTPERVGDHVMIHVESQAGIATTGVLVGLLLPAVQAARQAARRMSASNNLKQTMLALHNYHSAYRQLPTSAITDDDGKALLSWRVAILPFIEEQELYQQFHLDEPWDSEHNLPLSEQLPDVYNLPGKRLPPGHTVLQAVVGKEMGMRPLEKTAFRDFLDGLSNSVLILEVNDDAAVPWSKPADLEIDLNDPLANLGKARPGGFHVGLGDGSVRFLSENIDSELFKALLTRAGKERIGDF